MKLHRFLGPLLAMALGGCAAQSATGMREPPEGPASGYACLYRHDGPLGSVRIVMSLDLEGKFAGASTDWGRQLEGMRLTIGWGSELWNRPQDENVVDVYLPGAPKGGGADSGLLLRFAREGADEGPAPATSRWAGIENGEYVGGSTIGALKAAGAGGPVAVTAVAAGGAKGPARVLARAAFDPAVLDDPRAMIAEARPALEAMQADFRNRCAVTHDSEIIVT